MRLTILGCSPASTNPGGASSGYLVEEGDTRLMIDCGNGSFGNLLKYVAPEDVTGVVISHMHADHILDLLPYRYALTFAAEEASPGGDAPKRPMLYFPPLGHAKALAVSSLQDSGQDFFSGPFQVNEYDPARQLVVGDLTIAFTPVVHIPHTYAVRISSGGRTLVYSADTGPCAAIYEAACHADLFLCECSSAAHSKYPFHLTPATAGEIAQTAGVSRLLLTHRWYRTGLEEARAEARATFGGAVEMAQEGQMYDV